MSLVTLFGQKRIASAFTEYRPEIDVSGELQPNQASDYQSYIGILRWMVELGRVDICCEVSMMSSHLALPREGHLQELYHMFAYATFVPTGAARTTIVAFSACNAAGVGKTVEMQSCP